MKRKNDPRHLQRIKIIQALFAESFSPFLPFPLAPQKLFQLRPKLPKLDKLICQAAPQFPLEKIAKIDVAILRLALYELFFEKKEPAKVIIDEAVELAKEFGGEKSPAFVNGVLGTLYERKKTEEK